MCILLLLGSGSSNAVGIGTLAVLTQKVTERLRSEGFGHIVDHIYDVLKRKNQEYRYYQDNEIDIEVILSILNRCVTHNESLKELGPYALYSSDSCADLELSTIKRQDLVRLRSITANEITNHCLAYRKDDAFRYYSELLSLDKNIVNFRTANSTSNTSVFSKIVTLNYDLVIENVFEGMGMGKINRGFIRDSPEDDAYIPLQKILLNQLHPNQEIEYLKLHGSIDWRIRDSDKRIVLRDTEISLRDNPATEQLMIYPIYEKKLSEEFYFTFYYYFKRIMIYHEVYIVIGYSFRDHSINTGLYYGLRNNPSARMIVVTSNNAIRDRVNEYFAEFTVGEQHKVDFLLTKFGEYNFIHELRNMLE